MRLAAIVESSEDAIIGKDLNGVVLSWNSGAEQLYGYSEDEALGQHMSFLIPQKRQDEEVAILEAAKRGERVRHFETVRLRKNREPVHVSLTISPIRNHAGDVIGASHVARDITQRVAYEKALAHLAAIVESSGDAIVGKSPEGIIESWNPAAERLYGYTFREIVGRPMSVLLPLDRMDEEKNILARIRAGERVESFETVRITKSGAPVSVSLTVSPIRNVHGEIIGASHIARDITTQRQFREHLQQTQKMESLGLLAGGIAHDFNNLLTGILGNASLVLGATPASSPSHQRLTDVLRAAERASLLTKQLLAYAGKGQVALEMIDLSELAGEIGSLVQASISKKVHLVLELASGLPRIEGDPGQLQQVIMNLVMNGAEAIGEGAGTVTVRTWLQEVDELYLRSILTGVELPQGKYVVLEVHDTGAGMDEAVLSRIFDPFFTTKKTGRGLGLAAVMGIVRSHKGALKVYSTPGQGSTFKFLAPVAGTVKGNPKPKVLEAALQARQERILVVDDEELIRRFTEAALEHFGYQVTAAKDGEEALRLFQSAPAYFDLVIADLTMPFMDGEELFRRLQMLRPGLPVILTSGYHESAALRHFAGKGLSGFLQKPYSALDLTKRVRAVMDALPPRNLPE